VKYIYINVLNAHYWSEHMT